MGGAYAASGGNALETDQRMDSLGVKMLQMASSLKLIEHGTSDDLLAPRLELLKCYALAFQVLSRGLQGLKTRNSSRTLFAAMIKSDKLLGVQKHLDESNDNTRVLSRL